MLMLGNYPEDCANCLTSAQIMALNAENPAVADAINILATVGTWPSGDPGSVGYTIQDDVWGTVTMVTDANGNLYYLVPSATGNAPANPNQGNVNTAVATVASGTNAPPYVSSPGSSPATGGTCPGWSNIGSFNDFLACLGSAASGAGTLVFIVVAVWAYHELK